MYQWVVMAMSARPGQVVLEEKVEQIAVNAEKAVKVLEGER